MSISSLSTCTQEEDECQDLLSTNVMYKLKLKDSVENFFLKKTKKPFISIKSKRLMKQKRSFDQQNYLLSNQSNIKTRAE